MKLIIQSHDDFITVNFPLVAFYQISLRETTFYTLFNLSSNVPYAFSKADARFNFAEGCAKSN